jgi:hypothetical protein
VVLVDLISTQDLAMVAQVVDADVREPLVETTM